MPYNVNRKKIMPIESESVSTEEIYTYLLLPTFFNLKFY